MAYTVDDGEATTLHSVEIENVIQHRAHLVQRACKGSKLEFLLSTFES
jgi:hypothetical protein